MLLILRLIHLLILQLIPPPDIEADTPPDIETDTPPPDNDADTPHDDTPPSAASTLPSQSRAPPSTSQRRAYCLLFPSCTASRGLLPPQPNFVRPLTHIPLRHICTTFQKAKNQ